MRIVFLLSTFLFLTNAWSQIQGTEEVKGKKYYVYLVEKGNTLSQLERKYGVSTSVIEKDNPAVKNGLQIGQKLLLDIPLVTYVHTVKKGETLYRISNDFGVTVDFLISNNKAAENGVMIGQKLTIPGIPKHIADNLSEINLIVPTEKIPSTTQERDTLKIDVPAVNKPAFSLEDTVINHLVIKDETLYNLSKRYMVTVAELQKINNLKSTTIAPGTTLKIPISKENRDKIDIREIPSKVEDRKIDSTLLFPKKSTYKIAIMLPFKLDDVNSNPYAGVATDFYMGAKLALDSLEEIGLKAEVTVLDCGSDSLSMVRLLQNPDLKRYDLIFGSLMASQNEYAAIWAKINRIRFVSPVFSNTSIANSNQFVYLSVTSDFTLMNGLAKHVASKHKGEQIILVNSGLEKDQVCYNAFREAYLASGSSKIIEAKMDNFTTFVRRGINNIIVFPSDSKKLVSKFDIALTKVMTSSTSVQVYGTKEWVDFDDLNVARAKYKFGFASPTNFSYEDEKTKQLHRQFRMEYKSDMTKLAVHGFDVVYFFASNLLMNEQSHAMFMNDFEMKKINTTSGFENQKSYIFQIESGLTILQ
ncbi:MAG: LysM peptidoglycan-binding domain-containing protein [Bacteroidota bacterium]